MVLPQSQQSRPGRATSLPWSSWLAYRHTPTISALTVFARKFSKSNSLLERRVTDLTFSKMFSPTPHLLAPDLSPPGGCIATLFENGHPEVSLTLVGL